VILAAGLGNRLSRAAQGIPKPLLPLTLTPDPSYSIGSSPSFIDLHLKSIDTYFAASRETHVLLVGNQKTFEAPLFYHPKNFRLERVLNPTQDLSSSGSAHSLWFAKNSKSAPWTSSERVIFMDADIVYTPSLMGELLQLNRSTTLVSTRFRDSQEEVVVFENPLTGFPSLHGKGLLGTPMVRDLRMVGEATGIVQLMQNDLQDAGECLEWLMKYSTAKVRSEHEDLTQRLFAMGRILAHPLSPTLEFMECDTPEEYEDLLLNFSPRVLSNFWSS
jgi:choline kinase